MSGRDGDGDARSGAAAAGPGLAVTREDRKGIDVVAATRRYHDALNAFDMDAVEACFARDAVYLSPGIGGRIEGRDAIMTAFRAYFAIYPDQVARDDRIEAVSHRVARAAWRLTATHAVTREVVHRQGDETVGFDADGLIVEIEVRDRPAPPA